MPELDRLPGTKYNNGATNASLSSKQVSHLLTIDKAAKELLNTASERMNLSARSYFKVIKVAQTIADLAKAETIDKSHIAEALSYRS